MMQKPHGEQSAGPPPSGGFIVETHHAFTRDAITALPPLAAKVRGRHGDAHPETGSVETFVQRLVEDSVRTFSRKRRSFARARGGRPWPLAGA